jgi:nucleoside-diphosphate-sugar epimerase
MKFLITGIRGLVGSPLTEALGLEHGDAPSADTRRIEFRPENILEEIAQRAGRHAVGPERRAP